MPLRRRLILSPMVTAMMLWAVASALVLAHVVRADDFVMAEVRRHNLVPEFIQALAWFALPYLAIGAACATKCGNR